MGREKMTNLQPREEEEEEEESDQEQEDAISLCDLSTDHYQEDSDNYDNGVNLLDQLDRDSEEDKFEFSFTNPSSIITNQNDAGLADSDDNSINAVNFCGKIIGYNNNNNSSNNNTNSNNAKNYKQQGEAVNTTRVVENQTWLLKKSTSAQSLSRSQLATGSCRYRSSSSKSNSSRYKHKALIGLVKIPTEMELSDIKKRQSKMRNPTTTTTTSWPMLPVAAAAEPAVAGGDNGSTAGGDGSERRRNNSNRWGLFRSLTCGARLANVFA